MNPTWVGFANYTLWPERSHHARRFEWSPAETNGRKSRVQEGLNEEERRGRSLTWLLFQHFSSASFVKIFEKSLKQKKSHFWYFVWKLWNFLSRKFEPLKLTYDPKNRRRPSSTEFLSSVTAVFVVPWTLPDKFDKRTADCLQNILLKPVRTWTESTQHDSSLEPKLMAVNWFLITC